MPAGLTADRSDPLISDRVLGLIGVGVFTLLTGIGANIAIPLPPDGVPMSLQTLFVVLAAMSLGPKLGSASMVLYIVMGMIGAPLFAEGEKGLIVILGQTGGYLVGFVLCQPVVTLFIRRKDRTIRAWYWILAGAIAGHTVVFVVGVPWLWAVNVMDGREYTFLRALQGGFFPFIPGMILKCALATLIGIWAAPFGSRRGW